MFSDQVEVVLASAEVDIVGAPLPGLQISGTAGWVGQAGFCQLSTSLAEV